MSLTWIARPQKPNKPLIEYADGGDGWIYRRATFNGASSIYRARFEDVRDFAPSEREPVATWLPVVD